MASPSDFGYPLLAPDPGILNPDLALDAVLAPVVDYGDVPPRPLGKGWSFNFLTGQFVRHGAAPAEAFGLDNLRVWIEKCLRTARFAHPVYSSAFGMDDPFFAVGRVDGPGLEQLYQDRVTDALLAHDRIVSVDSFHFNYQPLDDALYVSFTVNTSDRPSQSLTVSAIPLGGAS